MPCVTINVVRPSAPNIVVEKVWTNPTEVKPSQEFEVWVRVKNTGTAAGEIKLCADIVFPDGAVAECFCDKTVTVNPGQSLDVRLCRISFAVSGNFTVKVGNLSTTVTVKEAPVEVVKENISILREGDTFYRVISNTVNVKSGEKISLRYWVEFNQIVDAEAWITINGRTVAKNRKKDSLLKVEVTDIVAQAPMQVCGYYKIYSGG